MSTYDDHMQLAKSYALVGRLEEALQELRIAQEIDDNEKVRRRIKKMEDALDPSELEEITKEVNKSNEEGFIELKGGLKIDEHVYKKLYPHQVQGIQWMWSCVHLSDGNCKGGLLSDDMGLGKTIQVSAFISALIDMGEASHFLIVLPTSLVTNWERELRIWCPSVNIFKYTGDLTKPKRGWQLQMAQRTTGVLLITYGLITTSADIICIDPMGRRFIWDYTILDEAHNIKNVSTKRTKEANKIRSKRRLLLTGTPIMNSLDDFYSLVKFFSHDQLLGNFADFKRDFKQPIERARVKDARPYEISLGNQMSKSLRDATKRYILRRTKDSVNANKVECNVNPAFPELSQKNDFVLWCKMTRKQLKIYTDFLQSEEVREVLMTRKSPLVQCTVLKKICDHPRRMSNRQCQSIGLYTGISDKSMTKEAGDACAVNSIDNINLSLLLEESGKLRMLDCLIDILEEKFLIFSSSIKLLDMVGKLLRSKNVEFVRMDGRDKIDKRDKVVNMFQNDKNVRAFMLTTGVGSVGLTLTAATRVIVFDPAWNPSCDDQAVDRIYRIGQNKPVVIFRLITCDTIEERIYRRQIFKKSIISQTNGENDDPFRHFDSNGIRQLFIAPKHPDYSETQVQLEQLKEKRNSYKQLDMLLGKFVKYEDFHAGFHDHNLVFDPENEPIVMNALTADDMNVIKKKAVDIKQNMDRNIAEYDDMIRDGLDPQDARNIRDRKIKTTYGQPSKKLHQPDLKWYFGKNGLVSPSIIEKSKLNESELRKKRNTPQHWRMEDDVILVDSESDDEIVTNKSKIKTNISFNPTPEMSSTPTRSRVLEEDKVDEMSSASTRSRVLEEDKLDEMSSAPTRSRVLEEDKLDDVSSAPTRSRLFQDDELEETMNHMSIDEIDDSLNDPMMVPVKDDTNSSALFQSGVSQDNTQVTSSPRNNITLPQNLAKITESPAALEKPNTDTFDCSRERSPVIKQIPFTPAKVNQDDFKIDITLESTTYSRESHSSDDESPHNSFLRSMEAEEVSQSHNSDANNVSMSQQTKTHFRRRSQLPIRKELMDDSEDEFVESFDGSNLNIKSIRESGIHSRPESSDEEEISNPKKRVRRILCSDSEDDSSTNLTETLNSTDSSRNLIIDSD